MTSERPQRKPEQVVCEHCGKATTIHGVPDPFCVKCGRWHLRGEHGDVPPDVRVQLLRDLEAQVYALPAEGRRHAGLFVERAAVLALLDPRRRKVAA